MIGEKIKEEKKKVKEDVALGKVNEVKVSKKPKGRLED